MSEEPDVTPAEAPVHEPVWDRRRREADEARRELRQSGNRRFAHRLTSSFVTLSGLAVALVTGGDPRGVPPSRTDYLLVAGLALFCVFCVWLVTRVDKTQPVSRIWLGKGAYFVFGMALTFAMPLLAPMLEKFS